MNSKDLEFKSYTLGDVKVIELLLLYRYKYDDYFFMKQESSLMAVNGVVPINEEVLLTYASLDDCIEKCKFDEVQLKMLELLGYGYTYEEISEVLGVLPSVIAGRMKTIYKRIVKENVWQWRKSIYKGKLELKTKTCSKCKDVLPATPEFYSDLERTKDGFHSQCRKCKK